MIPDIESKSKVGRPQYNIYYEREKAQSMWKPGRRDLKLQRLIVEFRRKQWIHKFGGERFENPYYAWSREWEKTKSEDARPYLDAEVAMIVCEARYPQTRYEKGGMHSYRPTWYDEFYWFVKFAEDLMAGSMRVSVTWGHSGRRPSVEKIYRTAVSILVARRFLLPNGGNSGKLPGPEAISQMWFLLFGEHESKDAIRKRMHTVGKFCKAFQTYGAFSGAERSLLGKLSKPILDRYPRR